MHCSDLLRFLRRRQHRPSDKPLHHLQHLHAGTGASIKITEIIHFTLLFTIFGQTNNATYDIIQTMLSSSIILVCFVPRVMNKYYSFLFTLLVVIFITLASASLSTILIIKYTFLTQREHLSELLRYLVQLRQQKPYFQFQGQKLMQLDHAALLHRAWLRLLHCGTQDSLHSPDLQGLPSF